jgi:hypothetical protein
MLAIESKRIPVPSSNKFVSPEILFGTLKNITKQQVKKTMQLPEKHVPTVKI